MASLYSKLIDELLTEIATMKKGDKLPSERQLCRDYDVSRTTVRNALGQLVNSGYLYQIQGKGTFVREQNRENLSNYYSFTEQTRKNDRTPKSKVLNFTIRDANPEEKKIFEKEEDFSIIVFDRLRLADDEPMMYERTFIPYDKFRKVDKDLLETKALYDIFEEDFGEKIVNVRERFSATSMGENVASSLKLRVNSPSLKIRRFAYNMENDLIEYTISFARPDVFYYETSYNPN